MNNISTTTGLNVFTPEAVQEKVQATPNPVQNFSWDNYVLTRNKKEARIRDLVKKSITAYTVDGIVRQAVDKYAEMFKDFNLDGGEKQVKYLKNRFTMIGLNTQEHWLTLFSSVLVYSDLS